MEIYFVNLKCPENGNVTEKIKADSIDEAKNIVKNKYPNCEIISIKQLLND